MDCVAKDGQLIMHVISEHVENAGVHSGDATLIQPPQDLDKYTIDQIVLATAKIAQGLRVTGIYRFVCFLEFCLSLCDSFKRTYMSL